MIFLKKKKIMYGGREIRDVFVCKLFLVKIKVVCMLVLMQFS